MQRVGDVIICPGSNWSNPARLPGPSGSRTGARPPETRPSSSASSSSPCRTHSWSSCRGPTCPWTGPCRCSVGVTGSSTDPLDPKDPSQLPAGPPSAVQNSWCSSEVIYERHRDIWVRTHHFHFLLSLRGAGRRENVELDLLDWQQGLNAPATNFHVWSFYFFINKYLFTCIIQPDCFKNEFIPSYLFLNQTIVNYSKLSRRVLCPSLLAVTRKGRSQAENCMLGKHVCSSGAHR